MTNESIKVGIGITTAGQIKSQTAFALCRMLKHFKGDYEILFKEGPNQPLNREVIAETALKMSCTHLLFIDSDMSFPKDALGMLLSRDKDLIGVNYYQRQLPPITTVKMNLEQKKELKDSSVCQCDAVATGFMLIKTSVFNRLSKPWFHVGLLEGGELEGHDYRFCRLVREAGFGVWVDFNIEMKHIGDYHY